MNVLDRVLNGAKPPVKRVIVNTPPRVFERESSAPTAPATDLIRKALFLVRENASSKIPVSTIAEDLGVPNPLLSATDEVLSQQEASLRATARKVVHMAYAY